MIDIRFDFKRFRFRRFVTPPWFTHYAPPTKEGLKYSEYQYRLAKAGKDHHVPEWSMRHPANEYHQLMAKEFWRDVPKDFSTILDVGCSDGYMVNVFKNEGKRAVGINDMVWPVDRAFHEANGLDVRKGDMHNMDIADGSFDAVWCRHTLEHAFAPLQVLSEIYRVLKPQGYLFAVLPPPPLLPEPYPDHWHQIPEYQFRYLLESCNFEVQKLWTQYFSYKRENDNLEIRAICRRID